MGVLFGRELVGGADDRVALFGACCTYVYHVESTSTTISPESPSPVSPTRTPLHPTIRHSNNPHPSD